MRTVLSSLIIVLLVAVSMPVPLASAQKIAEGTAVEASALPTREWVRRYNGPMQEGFDEAKAITLDSQGNIYVTGSSIDTGTKSDFVTIKYSPSGTTLWNRRYNGPVNGDDVAEAICLDTQGNVYVTGSAQFSVDLVDYAAIKYSPDGKQLWVRHYPGGGARAIALDDQDNVYVSGATTTIKYSPSGLRLRVMPHPQNFTAYAMAVDGQSNVYVTGFYLNPDPDPVDLDCATVKYGPDGQQLWVRYYNGPANDWDIGFAISLDGQGNVHIAGNSANGEHDFVTIKYSPDGHRLWVRRYNGPANGGDFVRGIALDTQGNVYIAGESYNSDSISNSDYAVIKYSPSGERLWVRRYKGPGYNDSPTAITIDGQGNCYVTGYSDSGNETTDYATIKYSPDGQRLWLMRYNGPGKGNDKANAMAVDGQGHVYVTGQSFGNGNEADYATVKYSQQ